MLERFVRAWAHTCLTYRKTILLVLAAITAFTGSQLPRVHFDNALATWFVEGDPALVNHKRLLDLFGSDELVVVGLEAEDVFAPEVLEKIDRATRAIEKAPHVEKVVSLTNVESITGKNDAIVVRDLVEFPLDRAALPAIRERALGDELYVGNVVSADARFTSIIVRLPHYPDRFDYKVEAVGAIRAILEREIGANGFYLAGGPAFDEQFFYASEADSARTSALMIVVLSVVLWLLTRSLWGVILPLATVITSTVWTVGMMPVLGVHANIITTIMPPLILAVGVADAMHVLVDYQNRCRAGDDKMTALHAVFEELMWPLFLAGFTTAIGMFSLTVSKVRAIREFGEFSALGVAAAFVLTVTFVPIVLSYLPVPRRAQKRQGREYLSTRALEALHGFTMRRGRAIVAVSVGLVVVAIGFAMQVKAESAFLKVFKPGAKIRLDTERIQTAMGGTVTVDVLVDTGRPDGVKDPAVLAEIVKLEKFLESQAHVSSAQSAADYFKNMRRAFHANDPREYRLPATREEAAQYLLLYEIDKPDGDLKDLVTFDYRQTRVTARVDIESSNAAAALVHATQAYMAKELPPDLRGTVTGLLVMYADMEEYIRDSMLQGFSGALASIFVIFCIQMRSIMLGSIVMLANSMSILMTLGIMGLVGIRLDSMTAMVASVAIGLADDDSIHFVSRVRSKLDAGIEVVTALRDALVEVGRALVYSGLALCAGFAVMLSSSFIGAMYFGLLTMLTIAIALLADLVLLPVLLRWYDRFRPHAAETVRVTPEPVAGRDGFARGPVLSDGSRHALAE